jgi:hypothetical protein
VTPLTPPRYAPLMRRLLGFLRPSALALAALATCACSKSAAPLAPALADVVFQGSADGPALDALLAVAPKASTDAAPIIDSPVDGTVLPADPPQRFAWHLPVTAQPAPAGQEPLNGVGYFLLYSTDATSRLFRVFTTETSYTPDEAAWATISSAGIWTKLTVVSATFADDQIAPGGGPFVGTPILFCVEHP